jgi:hypothetical protein
MKTVIIKIISENSLWNAGKITCREGYGRKTKIVLKYVKTRAV